MQRTLKLWRTFREGLTNFRRNGWLSFATITILSLSLFIISFAGLITIGTRLIVSGLENRISITVSFNPDVTEGRMVEMKQYLERAREIASIEYVSRERALEDFLANNGDDPIIRQAIDEIGENPLLASLVVRAKHQEDYEKIAAFLESSPYQTDINRINFEKNRRIFERLNAIGQAARKFGIALGSAFGLIAVLITFNTIRITIYSHRQEFEIMRLVGASNLYVRMPYIFEGILYGLCAGIVAVALVALAAYGLANYTQGAFPQGDLYRVFLGYAPTIIVSTLCLGVFLGVISSFIAIHRYLKT
ncbi:MAG: permease-like cell division protein FtsX [Candidatus Moraniibacteriota bacterium]